MPLATEPIGSVPRPQTLIQGGFSDRLFLAAQERAGPGRNVPMIRARVLDNDQVLSAEFLSPTPDPAAART